jgi:hypothetical protein
LSFFFPLSHEGKLPFFVLNVKPIFRDILWKTVEEGFFSSEELFIRNKLF